MYSLLLALTQDARIAGALKVTEQASTLGGNVFVVTIVLLILLVYLIAVIVPNARSQRNNTDKLTEVLAKIGSLVADTHDHASSASNNSGRIVLAMRVQSDILERINDAGPKLDIKSQLGEIRGSLAG